MSTTPSTKPGTHTPEYSENGNIILPAGPERLEHIRATLEENRQELTRRKKMYLIGLFYHLRQTIRKIGGSNADNHR